MAGNIAVLLVTLGMIFGLYAAWYRFTIRGLPGYQQLRKMSYRPRVFERLTPEESLNLGWAHDDRRHPEGSYLDFPVEKEPGTIRSGSFGCSFTLGQEAAKGHDYPSFLGWKFREEGYDNVEVINFGVGAYGNHQSYLLWDYLGRDYDLDYIVFMPFAWHVPRDDTFIFDYNTFGPIHARYILDGDSLKMIPVLGENQRDAIETYFGIIQPWRYLRYESDTPPFLKVLLPKGRQLKRNPFYYRPGMSSHEEIYRTYSLIIEGMAKDVPNLVVLSNNDAIGDLRGMVSSPNVRFLDSRVRHMFTSFPHRAPQGHPSALLNRLRAEELFAFMTGEGQTTVRSAEIVPRFGKGKKKKTARELKPFHSYQRAVMTMEDQEAGQLVVRRQSPGKRSRLVEVPPRITRAASLLHMGSRDGRFAGLPFMLRNGMPVSISFSVGGERVDVPVGKIRTQRGILGAVVAEGPFPGALVTLTGEGWRLRLNPERPVDGMVVFSESPVEEVSLSIGEQKVLVGDKRPSKDPEEDVKAGRNRFTLRPLSREKDLHFKPVAGQYPDPDLLEKKRGIVQLVLTDEDEDEDEEEVTVPTFIGYRVVRKKFPPFREKYPSPVPRSSR